MAIDVIVRPNGRCLTIVCDLGTRASDKIAIRDGSIYFCHPEEDFLIGNLTEEMLAGALECDIAVVVIMDGDFVHSSKQAKLTML